MKTPILFDPKQGPSAGKPVVVPDKPTEKSLPSNTKLSPALQTGVDKANQKNLDGGSSNLKKALKNIQDVSQ